MAALSQWSLWDADDSLPEATAASQSNDDLGAQAPPTWSCQLYWESDVKSWGSQVEAGLTAGPHLMFSPRLPD